jgi:hypothetical protein
MVSYLPRYSSYLDTNLRYTISLNLCDDFISSIFYTYTFDRNASFSPSANLAVGKSNNANDASSSSTPSTLINNDLTYHHAFALFQLYAAIINIPICIFWAGGLERVSAIVAEAPPISIVLVIIFSIIWGLGTLLFGIACKIAGIGIGTNLSMGIIAVIGSFLPLIIENMVFSPFGAIVCVGLLICCVGLWFSTKALAQRDEDEVLAKAQRSDDNENENDDDYVKNADSRANLGFPLSLNKIEEDTPLKGDDNSSVHSDNDSPDDNGEKNHEKKQDKMNLREYSTIQKVLVCVATGVTAVQLQFAFMFGSPITDLAKGVVDGAVLPGKTPYGGSSVIIWLFAISLGAPVSFINAVVSSPVPLSQCLKAPWWRHLRLIATTSLPWISHIHIYGLCATTLLPDKVAASIAWPLLMMITNLWALILSKVLGEWKVASQNTIKTFLLSVSVTMVGLLVLMCSIAVPTNA